jgi:hypothetical protein
MSPSAIADIVDQLARDDDYVALVHVIFLISDKFGRPIATIHSEDLSHVLKAMLDRGFVAVDLQQDGGIKPWPDQKPEAVMARIAKAWRSLGRPPTVGEVAYFHLPEQHWPADRPRGRGLMSHRSAQWPMTKSG